MGPETRAISRVNCANAMKSARRSAKLLLYYLVISKLPHSRQCRFMSHMRRWYVSRILRIMTWHKESEFQNNIYIGDGSKVQIGEFCRINENVFLQGAAIGDYVMIAPNVTILSKSDQYSSTDIPMIQQGETDEILPVIEDDVWIGRNAIIMPGICIGKGSVVAAGAVVTKNVEPYSVVGGVPARLIKRRK